MRLGEATCSHSLLSELQHTRRLHTCTVLPATHTPVRTYVHTLSRACALATLATRTRPCPCSHAHPDHACPRADTCECRHTQTHMLADTRLCALTRVCEHTRAPACVFHAGAAGSRARSQRWARAALHRCLQQPLDGSKSPVLSHQCHQERGAGLACARQRGGGLGEQIRAFLEPGEILTRRMTTWGANKMAELEGSPEARSAGGRLEAAANSPAVLKAPPGAVGTAPACTNASGKGMAE